MSNRRPALNRTTRALGLCAALVSASLSGSNADALDITGLIKVNGNEMPGVLVAVYDCADGSFIGQTYTGATDASGGAAMNYAITVDAENVRIELYYHPQPDLVPLASQCREFIQCGQIIPSGGTAVADLDMTCDFDEAGQPGVAGPGYWKNHPRDWPVNAITIGGRTHPRLQAIILMSLPERGDKTKTAFRHLAAAKLNVLAGNDGSCIAGAIEAADAWLARNPMCSGVRASSAAWKRISGVIARLEAYNSGQLCAPTRGPGDEDDDRRCRFDRD